MATDTVRDVVDTLASPDQPAASDGLLGLLGPTRAHLVSLVAAAPRTVAELAEQLHISEVAVRRHVGVLIDEGWVEGIVEEPSGRGRPATRYSLTEHGHELLPQQYASLAAELLTYLQVRAGEQGLADYLTWRARRQADRLAAEVDADAVDDRLTQLAGALSAQGSPASVERTEDGYVLRQHHCTVLDVARQHPELCHAEAAEFGRVLGAGVTARRGVSRAEGGRTCECAVVVTDAVDDGVPAGHRLPVVSS